MPRCVPAVTHQPKHTGNQSAHALSSPLEHGSKMEKQIKETEKRRPKMPPVNQRSDSLFFFSIEEKQAKRHRCAFSPLSSVYTRDEHSAFFSSLPPFEWVLVSFFHSCAVTASPPPFCSHPLARARVCILPGNSVAYMHTSTNIYIKSVCTCTLVCEGEGGG